MAVRIDDPRHDGGTPRVDDARALAGLSTDLLIRTDLSDEPSPDAKRGGIGTALVHRQDRSVHDDQLFVLRHASSSVAAEVDRTQG